MPSGAMKDAGTGGSEDREERVEQFPESHAVRFANEYDSLASGIQEVDETAPKGADVASQSQARSEHLEVSARMSVDCEAAYPSLVADTMKRIAPSGLVHSPDWAVPTLTRSQIRLTSKNKSLTVGPILHSLQGSLPGGGAKLKRRLSRGVTVKPDPLLQPSSHIEVTPSKYVNILYETCVKNNSPPDQRQSMALTEAMAQLVRLLALQADSANGSAQNQYLDETGHADLSKIKTEQDAVAFFACHGSTTKTRFLFCNRPPADPLEFEPYKLVVVPHNQVNPEHFTISPTAVMHICPGKPSECIRQDEWMRQAFVHSVLRSLRFFKTFVAKKVLSLWSHASRTHMFEQRREMLCKTLFLAKPIYCDHLLQIHNVLVGVSSVKLVELQPILYESSQFIAQQHALHSDPKTGTGKELEAKHAEVRSLVVTLMQKLQEATQLPELDPMEACSINKAKSIFQAKREAAEQQRLIRLAYRNQALLGRFILLVDLLFTTRLTKAVTGAAAAILGRVETEETCSKLFSVNVSFGSTRIEFDPSRTAFISMLNEVWEGIISTVSNVPLLVQCRQFEDSVIKGPIQSLEVILNHLKHIQLMKSHWRVKCVARLQKKVEERVLKDFERARKYSESYFGIYRQIYEYGENWDEESFTSTCTTHDELSSEMELMSEFEEKLDKLNPVHVVGLFSIEARGLKSSLQPVTEKALSFMKRRLWKLMKDHVRATASRFETINRRLDERPTKLIQFVCFLGNCHEIKSQLEDLDRDKAIAEEMFALLKQYGVRLAVEDTIQLENLLNSARDFEKFKLLDAAEHIRRNTEQMKAELKMKTEEVEREMEELGKLISDDEFSRAEAFEDAKRCFEKLKDYQERINYVYSKAEMLRGMRELLIPDSPAVLSKQAVATFSGVQPKVAMWENICLWQTDTAKWLGVPLVGLNAEEVEQGVTKYLKEACIAVQNFPADLVAAEFKKEVEQWRSRLSFIMDLGNQALRRQHWATIFEELKIFGTEQSISLGQLDQKGAFSKRDFINEVSTLASVQQSLSQMLEKIVQAWESRELLIKAFEDDNNAFIIRDLSDVLSMLEDHQISMQRMLHNPYVGPLKENVKSWAGKLDLAQQVVEELALLQRQWIGLQSIFSSREVLEQLPDETEAFEQVNSFWRTYLRRIRSEQCNILTVVKEDGLLELLADKNKTLAAVQRKLEDFVDTKRSAFPRFYFLSSEELLKLVSKGKQPAALQESFKKCFAFVYGVALAPNGTTIQGLYSDTGDLFNLLSPVSALAPVEEWFSELEEAIIVSLRQRLKLALESKVAGEECTGKWLSQNPAQCAMTATMIAWSSQAEAALEAVSLKGDLQALERCIDGVSREIEGLALLHEQNGNPASQLAAQSLIVLMVHARDILESLRLSKSTCPSCFEWKKQLRFYWHGDDNDCDIEQLHAKFRYRHEYLGCASRLVITPLTAKCFVTLTSALHLAYGGAPSGPAGTGKTETVKDLAKALGVPCLVFNCSSELDHQMTSRLFSGLAQSGAWACFDEFNRIEVEVLSVVAQQLLTIQTAIRAKRAVAEFDGKSLSVDSRVGVFITNNPGYAGRTQLPENLKSLFRPVSMVVPDATLICEVLLFARGFLLAKTLAKKVVQVFSTAKTILSQQRHYDWGLRAMKTVLLTAGAIKKKHLELSEVQMLIRALQGVVPRLVSDDVPVFLSVVAEVFTQKHLTIAKDDPVKSAFEETLQRQHLQAPFDFVEKAVQLYETQLLRHGILLVGAPGVGKSTLLLGLSEAISRIQRRSEPAMPTESRDAESTSPEGGCTVLRVNPKAMQECALFGRMDLSTKEWLDGIVSAHIRDVAASQLDKHRWLVLDGPLDPTWAEDLNSALDDNKTLCLSNGERIVLPGNFRIFFEVSDLGVASPATVSRCGTVYIEPGHLGYEPLMHTWRQTFAGQKTKFASFADAIGGWCLKVIQKALPFLRHDCNSSISLSDTSLVASVCRLLTGLLSSGLPQILPEESLQTLASMNCILALSWGLGGHLNEASRKMLSKQIFQDLQEICKELKHVPVSASIYDIAADESALRFTTFNTMIPQWEFANEGEFSDVFVPTPATVAHKLFLDSLVKVGHGCMLVGKPGSGKSMHLCECIRRPLDSVMCCKMVLTHRIRTYHIEDFLTSRFVKRHRRSLGPPHGCRMLFIVDDLTSPAADKFGSQRPLQFLRQLVEYRGFYEQSRFQFIHVEDTSTLLAGDIDSGRGITDMSRLLRHFNILYQDEAGPERLKNIFKPILLEAWKTTTPALCHCAGSIIDAIVTFYERAKARLLPTPLKCHYCFNPRDIAKAIEGILMADPTKLSSEIDVVRLGLHEMQRQFKDRLVSIEDRKWTERQLMKRFTECTRLGDALADLICSDIVFGDFAQSLAGRTYMEITLADEEMSALLSRQDLACLLFRYLEQYNAVAKIPLDLVFFEHVNKHIARLCRILRMPKGNALLLGANGSGAETAVAHKGPQQASTQQFLIDEISSASLGRESLALLAASMMDYNTAALPCTPRCGPDGLREDLRDLIVQTCADKKDVVFRIPECKIKYEEWLQDIASIICTGEIHGLFDQTDRDQLSMQVKGAERPDAVKFPLGWEAVLALVQHKIHFVISMSALGETFRNRCRRMPGLINGCISDFYDPWPRSALQAISMRFFTANSKLIKQEEARMLSSAFAEMYTTAERVTERFTATTGEPSHVTCTSFVEVVQVYLSLFDKKMLGLEERLRKYTSGICKLEETKTAVESMKAKLKAAQPLLEKSKLEAKMVAVSLEEDKQRVELIEEGFSAERAVADKARLEAQLIKDECQRDLDEVLPALQRALKSLEALDKRDIQELKSFPSPPTLVGTVLSAVCLLLGRKQSWEEAKKVLNDTALLANLRDYEKDNLPPKMLQQLSKYTALEDFVPERVATVSKAATSLCLWVRAVESYAQVVKVMEPKQKRLREAEEELRKAENNLAEKQQALEEVRARVKSLTEQHSACQDKVMGLEALICTIQEQLSRAESILSGVSVEGLRWNVDAKALGENLRNLLSDALLAAGMLVYAGPLTREFRDSLIHQWRSICVEEGIPAGNDFELSRTLSTPTEIRQWTLEGLPADVTSIENAVLVSSGAKWPLFVDPQDQGSRWFRNRQYERGFQEFSWSAPNAVQLLAEAATAGMTILINLPESGFDTTTDTLIAAARIRRDSRAVIRIGDRTVFCNAQFRMVLATKVPASKLPLELYSALSIVSFCITPSTLEEQLLRQIILHETPHLEEQRSTLVIKIARDMELKASIQEKILVLLANAEGDILADDTFLEFLEDSRTTYEAIERRMSEASVAADKLEQTRQRYRPLAQRGSLLYLALCDLSLLDPFYQWSLEAFTNQLQSTLSSCQDNTENRRDTLEDMLTWNVYCSTCRGLLGAHSLVFAFAIAKAIDVQAGSVSQETLDFFMRGAPENETASTSSTPPQWINQAAWRNIIFLDSRIGGQFQGLAEAVKAQDGEWRTLLETGEDLAGKLPQINGKNLKAFESLVVVKALRDNELHAGCRVYVQNILGPRYISPPQQDYLKALEESTAFTPLLFILFPGNDPIGPIKALRAHAGLPDEKLHLLSLGQGQHKVAEQVLQHARVSGDWVCLQNCHLAESFMPMLQQLHDGLRKNHVHQDFRLILTCQPTKILPAGLVKQSIKFTTEPPQGLRESVMRSLADLDSSGSEDIADCPDYKRWLFSLALFHSIILERRRLGAVGWNKGYEWTTDDFLISQRSLYESVISGGFELSWEQNIFLIADIHYGGRVTESLDQRLLTSLLRRSFAAVTTNSDVQDRALQPYTLPPDYRYRDIKEFAMSFPVDATPEVLALDAGAAMVSKEILSASLFSCLLVTHRQKHALNAENHEESLLSLAADILAILPETVNIEAAAGSHAEQAFKEQRSVQELSPLDHFLRGEVQAYNSFLACIRVSLTQLQGAIRGWSVMTEEMDDLNHSIYFQVVPKTWIAASYPSQLTLGRWLHDLQARIHRLRQWVQLGPPRIFHVPSFFKPQCFFAATLRVFARATQEPLDGLVLSARVTTLTEAGEADVTSDEEVLIGGLSLQGAIWSFEEGTLKDANAKALYHRMPPIQLSPASGRVEEQKKFKCPIYRTRARASDSDIVGFLDLPTGS
ncbi:hypothetical protein Efla_006922 [Eimeria flavescens]